MVGHKYTEREHAFLREFIPGHTYKEIVAEYNKTFDEPITAGRVKGYMANHKINNGLTGRFQKGQIPFNKGKKGWSAPGTEKTRFKKGHLPHNTKPLGYERVTKDGYIEVKIAERPNRQTGEKNFRPKHHIVWEAANGPVPKGYIVIFLDGDPLNCALENLALVSRAEHLQLTRRKLRSNVPELTETGVLIARAGVLVNEKIKRKKSAE